MPGIDPLSLGGAAMTPVPSHVVVARFIVLLFSATALIATAGLIIAGKFWEVLNL